MIDLLFEYEFFFFFEINIIVYQPKKLFGTKTTLSHLFYRIFDFQKKFFSRFNNLMVKYYLSNLTL